MTVAWLPNTFRGTALSDLVFGVFIAPGADLTAASGTWTFTDITADVLFTSPLQITVGRGDEQSKAQSAQCSFTVLNDAGTYTPRRAGSVFFPNMRLGFPVKVVATSNGIGGSVSLFTGYVDEIAPGWDESTKVPTASFTVKGSLQRLQQGNKQVSTDAIGQAATDQSLINNVAAYWPGTDGDGSTQISSGISGGYPMTVNGGVMDFANFTGFPTSNPLMVFGTGANLQGLVNPNNANTSGAVYFRCLLNAASILGSGAVAIRLATTGTAKTWRLLYGTGGTGKWQLKAYDVGDFEIDTTGSADFGFDGRPFYLSVELVQSGADVNVLIDVTRINADGSVTGGLITDTFTGMTVGRCTRIDMGASGTMTGWAVGHVGVANTQSWLFASSDLIGGYIGESPTTRISRVCAQAGVPVSVSSGSNVNMGPQTTGDLMTVLAECEEADHGLLYDGDDFGINYLTRGTRTVTGVSLALDIRDGQVMPPFQPLENTRLVHNDITVTRSGGGSARSVQASGQAYAAGMVGVFSDSTTLNLENDSALLGHSTWLLSLGTVDLDRFPTLALDLSASPALAVTWLNFFWVGVRISITGLPTTGGLDPDLFVEGFTLSMSPVDWMVDANCSPVAPYKIAFVNSTGTQVQTTGATTSAGASMGATSLSVASSILWGTGQPAFDLYVGGYKVSCTNITGASSPQTFTVSSLPAAVPSGATVKVWNPAIVSLGA